MSYKLDKKDKKILEILKDHANYSTRQIAKKTLFPITTIHNRIQKLKKEKIIKKFTVELDHPKVDKGLLVYILISASLPTLKQKKKSQYDLAKDLRKFEFVEKVDIVSGGTDLVATIRVKDVQEYDKVLLGKIQMIEGIDKTQSLIVIH
ncbi:Lrp/AsnC family transcriptional regulator [archaeon]|jgi:Lrp/AsnC family transcriptional regulator, leucine-responsive regulatory protein|nr:Lrp/AsnC family transcriptional regulator [archaeon]MBT3451547.1 Lrp/AsnC family transcriptional regulator [archaeon]MBT6869406.1 Lrp/AsnC family transcriptional regulator [archaeon]MBT7192569.1 Lrp/AsnC family transcriptional regulator [archaeon]MBT7380645.1 Lrp/AsnC family transcriptional regulator [archaeon]